MSKILNDEIIPALKDKIPNLPIGTNDIANGAVAAAKADVEGIMNSAGNNGQLFGLGGNAISISNSNLNNLQRKSGFYTGTGLTNAPNNNTNWWYIEQIVHNSSWVLQRATYLNGTNDIYQRELIEGVWSAWQRIMTPYNTLDQVYPVGSIYESSTLDNYDKVEAALGGKWVFCSTYQLPAGTVSLTIYRYRRYE